MTVGAVGRSDRMATALPYGVVLALATLSGLTTLVGVGLALVLGRSERGAAAGIGFSTGIMLAVAGLELLPEAAVEAGIWRAAAAGAGGLLFVRVADSLFAHIHLVRESGPVGDEFKSAYLVAFGLILHDFPEGFAMANSYLHSPALGLLIALAIGLHNVPEEFAMCLPIVPTGNRRLMFKLAVLSGLSEPAGALVGLVAVGVAPALNPLLMAVAAGAMGYVSVHELIPMAARYGKPRHFGAGVALSAVAYWTLSVVVPRALT